jgi:PAS domain S-box-containing protein
VDISDRKRMEDARRESEDHYRYMVQLNPQMPWIMEPSGKIVEVSPHWEKITGQSPEETLSSGWKDSVHPEDLERMLPRVRVSLQSGDPFDVEYRVRTRDGEWRWMRSRGKARRDEDGEILLWYGSTEDVDDYMQLKQTLRETEAKLALLEEKKLQ